MNKILRIGTRDSQLAVWQSEQVKVRLERTGIDCELLPQKSEGDLRLDQPLYELGITGIFTRTLDIALLEERIDIAVHSLKDVPTRLPNGLVLAAVLERGPSADIVVWKDPNGLASAETTAHIATGSLRRRAQWLHKYPGHQMEDLRGNVQTRLHKLANNPWQGAIFAEAGLARMKLLKDLNWKRLDWMLPAPAQGIVGIICREDDSISRECLASINDQTTHQIALMERSFMRTLEGGCTAPIGAYGSVSGESYHLKGCVLSLDGQQCLTDSWQQTGGDPTQMGERCAQELLEMGASTILQEVRVNEPKNSNSPQI
ncbi:MAG: hydroxymethylbilane synthase [Bacteroidota bacterium]